MARSFNGSTDKITATNASVFNQNTYSLSLWVKVATSSPSAYSTIIERAPPGDDANRYGGLFVQATRKLSIYVQHAGSTTLIDPGAAALTTGLWTHVAWRYSDATGVALFIAGNSDSSNPASVLMGSVTADWLIGNSNTSNAAFNGSVADVAQYGVLLTNAEIAALAAGARPFNVRKGSLVAYWPLDGLASPEPDLSGNRNNGTITGTTFATSPPMAPFTSRHPQLAGSGVGGGGGFVAKYRKMRSPIGTRIGARQIQL